MSDITILWLFSVAVLVGAFTVFLYAFGTFEIGEILRSAISRLKVKKRKE